MCISYLWSQIDEIWHHATTFATYEEVTGSERANLALTWWLKSLERPSTRKALIEDQAGSGF